MKCRSHFGLRPAYLRGLKQYTRSSFLKPTGLTLMLYILLRLSAAFPSLELSVKVLLCALHGSTVSEVEANADIDSAGSKGGRIDSHFAPSRLSLHVATPG